VNFPENKRTGELGELDITRLFTSWSWTVGKDHIDTGYDLNVEPSTAEFRGHRFLVQVKSTKHSKRGKVVARVAKMRMRQYAKNPLPVFLIRVTPDGKFYWLHVQPWAKANMLRLAEDGEAGVSMPEGQTLENKERFVDYLRDVFRPAAERMASLPELAEERSNYLSQIDPRLLVKAGLKDGGTSYELHAKEHPVEFQFNVTPIDQIEGGKKLIDAIRFGLPTTVEVDNLSFSGSRLFDAIGMTGSLKGRLSIGANNATPGIVTLHPGTTYSMLATALPLPARLYRGQEGFSVTNDGVEGIFGLNVRGDMERRLNFNLGLRSEKIEQAPLRDFHELGVLGDWAHEVMKQGAMTIELKFWSTGPAMKTTVSDIEGVRPILRFLFWIGRLHKVAKALDSDWILSKDFRLAEDDENDTHLAYWLLKGERREVGLGPIQVVDAVDIHSAVRPYEYVLQTALVMSIDNRKLGVMPIRAELSGFNYETLEPGKGQLVRTEGAKSFMYLNDGGPIDKQMFRKRPEEWGGSVEEQPA